MDKIIFAENSGNYYALDPAKIKEHITVTFDDYANRHWWEKGVYYNYDFIISVNSACILLGYKG